MLNVTPPSQHSVITDESDEVIITIPSPAYYCGVLYMLGALVGWFLGLIIAATAFSIQLEESPDSIPGGRLTAFLWIGFWIFGFLGVIIPYLWHITGRETIEVREHEIVVGRQVLWWRRNKRYKGDLINAMRVTAKVPLWRQYAYSSWPLGKTEYGVIAFDYGARTYYFGRGIDEAEGKRILAVIQQRFPQYTTWRQ